MRKVAKAETKINTSNYAAERDGRDAWHSCNVITHGDWGEELGGDFAIFKTPNAPRRQMKTLTFKCQEEYSSFGNV